MSKMENLVDSVKYRLDTAEENIMQWNDHGNMLSSLAYGNWDVKIRGCQKNYFKKEITKKVQNLK